MRALVLVASLCLAIAFAPSARSQNVPDRQTLTSSIAGEHAESAASLIVWSRPLATFRVPFLDSSPQQRADAAAARIEALLDTATPESIEFSSGQIGDKRGILVRSGSNFLFGLLPEDLPQDTAVTLEAAGVQAVARAQQLLRDRREQRTVREIVRDLVKSGLATLVFFALWQGLRWARGRVLGWLDALAHRRGEALASIGLDLRPILLNALTWLVRLSLLAIMLGIAYVWVLFVLSSFPLTRPWGEQLGSLLLQTSGQFVLAAAGQIPDLITLTLIILIARAFARLIKGWFRGVADQTTRVSWLSPEAAVVTRRLVLIGMWLFTLTVAYPYIPGSQSNAFKGVTVFVGLMVSFASQGVVNQILSGLVVVYTKELHVGDHIRVGDVTGTVTEIGMISTRIATLGEEVTVPNALIVGSSIRNYSRARSDQGVAVSIATTIGYDTPWRQVHALLEEAASHTKGIRTSPRPFVLQSELSDFYVHYRLYFNIDDASDRLFIISRLHAEILDAFNAHGVQIMSPHFIAQPEQAVVVPRAKWFTAPAEDDSGPAAARTG